MNDDEGNEREGETDRYIFIEWFAKGLEMLWGSLEL